MNPVSVSVTVPHDRTKVFDYLSVLANHEDLFDHVLTRWRVSGPLTGPGGQAHVRLGGGPSVPMTLALVEAHPPRTIVDQAVAAGGRSVTRAVYVLDEAPGVGTRVSLDLEWVQATLLEQALEPALRALLRRALAKAMGRLALELDELRPIVRPVEAGAFSG